MGRKFNIFNFQETALAYEKLSQKYFTWTFIRTSTWSNCVIHYACINFATHAQFGANITEGVSDPTSIIATKCWLSTEPKITSPISVIDQNQFRVCEAKITCEMAFEKFLEGCKAEAVDECGVWCPCTVLSKTEEGVNVSFDGWNAAWMEPPHLWSTWDLKCNSLWSETKTFKLFQQREINC